MELASSVGSQALFGAAFGGLSYGFNRIAGPAAKPTTTDSGNAHITTYNDASGQPVKFEALVPARYNADNANVVWNSTKMTDGSWQSSGYAVSKTDGGWSSDAAFNKIADVNRSADGTVVINDTDGNVRTFTPDKYARTNPVNDAAAAAKQFAANNFDRVSSNGDREVATTADGFRRFDGAGRLTALQDQNFGVNSAYIDYDAQGNMSRVSVSGANNSAHMSLARVDNDTWTFMKGDDQYTWKGNIEQVKDASGKVDSLAFKPADGGETQSFSIAGGAGKIRAAVEASGQYKALGPGLPSAKIGPQGDVLLAPGLDTKLYINGKQVSSETAIKAGDQVRTSVNVNDEFNDWRGPSNNNRQNNRRQSNAKWCNYQQPRCQPL